MKTFKQLIQELQEATQKYHHFNVTLKSGHKPDFSNVSKIGKRVAIGLPNGRIALYGSDHEEAKQRLINHLSKQGLEHGKDFHVELHK
jgi:preprotein translocase subunit Sss1